MTSFPTLFTEYPFFPQDFKYLLWNFKWLTIRLLKSSTKINAVTLQKTVKSEALEVSPSTRTNSKLIKWSESTIVELWNPIRHYRNQSNAWWRERLLEVAERAGCPNQPPSFLSPATARGTLTHVPAVACWCQGEQGACPPKTGLCSLARLADPQRCFAPFRLQWLPQ